MVTWFLFSLFLLVVYILVLSWKLQYSRNMFFYTHLYFITLSLTVMTTRWFVWQPVSVYSFTDMKQTFGFLASSWPQIFLFRMLHFFIIHCRLYAQNFLTFLCYVEWATLFWMCQTATRGRRVSIVSGFKSYIYSDAINELFILSLWCLSVHYVW